MLCGLDMVLFARLWCFYEVLLVGQGIGVMTYAGFFALSSQMCCGVKAGAIGFLYISSILTCYAAS